MSTATKKAQGLRILCVFNRKYEGFSSKEYEELTAEGHDVTVVRSLKMMGQAIEEARVKAKAFDVILGDHYMPIRSKDHGVSRTESYLQPALKGHLVKVIGFFALRSEPALEFDYIGPNKNVIRMTQIDWHTITGQRDVLRMLEHVWDNYEALRLTPRAMINQTINLALAEHGD